ncbi:unnamed protein product [Closterium sp. NIES-54]
MPTSTAARLSYCECGGRVAKDLGFGGDNPLSDFSRGMVLGEKLHVGKLVSVEDWCEALEEVAADDSVRVHHIECRKAPSKVQDTASEGSGARTGVHGESAEFFDEGVEGGNVLPIEKVDEESPQVGGGGSRQGVRCTCQGPPGTCHSEQRRRHKCASRPRNAVAGTGALGDWCGGGWGEGTATGGAPGPATGAAAGPAAGAAAGPAAGAAAGPAAGAAAGPAAGAAAGPAAGAAADPAAGAAAGPAAGAAAGPAAGRMGGGREERKVGEGGGGGGGERCYGGGKGKGAAVGVAADAADDAAVGRDEEGSPVADPSVGGVDLGAQSADLDARNADLDTQNADLVKKCAGGVDLGAGGVDLGAGGVDMDVGVADLSARRADLGAGRADLGAGRADLGAGRSDLGVGRSDLGAGVADLDVRGAVPWRAAPYGARGEGGQCLKGARRDGSSVLEG